MPTPLTLEIFKGDARVGTREFNLDIIKIGRLSAANLCLDDERVSRIHSVIDTSSGGAISILDMGSPEGTWVNGKRVNKGVLAGGDEIRLGNTRLVVRLPGEAKPEPPAVPEAPPAAPVAPPPASAAPPAAPDIELPSIAVAPEILEESPAAAPAPAAEPAPVEPDPIAAPPEATAVIARPRVRGTPRRVKRRAVPEADEVSDRVGVEVRVFWGDTLLGSTFRERPKAILVGASAHCDFQIPGQGLPAADFPIVEAAAGDLELVFSADMDGEIQRPGEGARRLRTLAAEHASAPHASLSGCQSCVLPKGSFAWVQLTTLRLEIEVKTMTRRFVAPFWEGLDYRWLNLLLVLGIAMLGFILTAATTPLDTDTTADDLFRNPTAMAKFIVRPPPKTKNAFAEKLKKESEKLKGEAAAKHKGKEGKMGRRDAPNRNARSAPKAIDVNAKDVVKNSGLMRLLGGGSGGLATILGNGGLGGDLKGALGHMFGPAVGDAGGLGGLGLRGTGVGGGGFGNTIGIGDIGTKGRGGGLGGYGNGIGTLGRKGGSDIAISSGNPIVEGSIDKELIRRVIHQHRNQVRFCYESELVRHPGMNGKVTVKFVIGASGGVLRANVDNSTLGNATVESCIVSRIYQWQFPKPKGGGIVVVNYPFLLKESGD